MKRNRSPSPPPLSQRNSIFTRLKKYILSYGKKKRVGVKNIVSAKRVAKSALVRRAARKYTYVWNKIMKEANNIDPKTNFLPQNFVGNVKEKYNRALTYKKRLVNFAYMHPRRYDVLYRGIKGMELEALARKNIIHKVNLTSFTRSYAVAKRFAGAYGSVIALKPTYKIPSVDYTTGYFKSEFSKGGAHGMNSSSEEYEVLLPPGTFVKRNENKMMIHVDYFPDYIV
jgi:hypothetical protein